MSKTMTMCPECKADLEVSVSLDVKMDKTTELQHTILGAIRNYHRWKAEGEKPYMQYRPHDCCIDESQLYYDDYHARIEYDYDSDTYSFSIQLYDSPEGDTWIRGKARLVNKWNRGLWIEIVEKEYHE